MLAWQHSKKLLLSCQCELSGQLFLARLQCMLLHPSFRQLCKRLEFGGIKSSVEKAVNKGKLA